MNIPREYFSSSMILVYNLKGLERFAALRYLMEPYEH